MQQRAPRRVVQQELNRAQIEGEIGALTAQRGELQAQMEQLSRRRNQLDERRHVTSAGPVQSQLVAQMAEIDARSARIDAQIMGLNDRISAAMGRLAELPAGADRIVQVPEIRIPDIQFGPGFRRGPDMREVAGIMAAEAVALVLIGVVFWRLGMKRMRDRFDRMFSAQTQQLTQLQQAMDVVGVEVERISEGQRYVTKVLTEGAAVGASLSSGRQESVPAKRDG
jgi:cell division protein FtsB